TGGLEQTLDVVIEADPSVGVTASSATLSLKPDVATIRLEPTDGGRFLILPKPEGAWGALESMALTLDPPVKELQVTRTTQSTGEEVSLKFDEPEDFDKDEYPIETMLRSTATFKGQTDHRFLERRVVITPSKRKPLKPRAPL